MTKPMPLRVFYLEDNPLIVFHIEAMIEDLGHVFSGSLSSFAELKVSFGQFVMDCALVDIDLADGPTGPEAAEWLLNKGIPSIFVTGQAEIAAKHAHISLGTIVKPVADKDMAAKLELFRSVIIANS
ncbi:response regulator [Bosea sp. (in: a-proteobacteria)]|uniref:response regulator n=1 Tax=Bosea sp. (in: a-proteobacteria) TaxID=1871050 RepID=UPI00273467EB|nr:response regulator [Bosea sp. (in: a-proteobacteria)]MDP3256373.1 response regulator [Bosea sp. (in: a-proteobacteria)]